MSSSNNLPLVAGFGIAAVGISAFAFFANWSGIAITVDTQTVANVLAPLTLTSGFIERAVEVFITPWRDQGYNRLDADLKTVTANPAATPAQIKEATDKLNDYVAETTRYAFVLSVFFGLVAAMVGVRALWPFLGSGKPETAILNPGQRNTFVIFDVILSAGLMAGGANGIHSVVTAFTSFFDASAQKSQNSVNQ